jgi:hypothetical protein
MRREITKDEKERTLTLISLHLISCELVGRRETEGGVVSNCFNTLSGTVYHVAPRSMNVVLKLYLQGYPVKWIQQQL